MKDYQTINKEVKEFIVKHNDGTTPIIDLICEYCLRSGLPEEAVGDAISEDPELARLIDWNMNSCTNNDLEQF